MRFLSPHECGEWCQARGFRTDPPADATVLRPPCPPHLRLVHFVHPVDSGARVSLARLLYSLLQPGQHLLWLNEWGVWPSSEHQPLVLRLREALKERRPLIDAPGLLADPADTEDATSFLVLALLFSWDCTVFSGVADEALFVSHDEDGWYGSADELRLARVRNTLELRLTESGSA